MCEIEQPSGLGYRLISSRHNPTPGGIELPRMPLPPGATVVIPLATALGPIRDISFHAFRTEYRDVTTGECEIVSHCSGEELIHQTALIGTALWPISLEYNDFGTQRRQEIHELDLTNMYTINRSWECGCCSHWFLERNDSTLAYGGELWAAAPDFLHVCTITVPDGVRALLIAELQNEVTHVAEVSVASRTAIRDRLLMQGQSLRITVNPGDLVSLKGYYVPDASARNRGIDPWRKNRLVLQFMNPSSPSC